MKNLFIIANWMQGAALSGGDRIFIELAKRWGNKLNVSLFVSKEGNQICCREGLNLANQKIWASDIFSGNRLSDGVYRTLNSIFHALRVTSSQEDIILSSSDFMPDSLPAFIIKLRNPKVKWIASFYLFAPRPWKKNSPYKGTKRVIGLMYWLSQIPAYYMIKKFADLVFVTSQPDVNPFITKKRPANKVIVVQGGVDTSYAREYFKSREVTPIEERKYDACFVGRFHYQKGVLELIQIWREVCKKRSQCRLAMIGTGPLDQKIKRTINQLKIKDNIDLFGFMDGSDKFDVFKQSKIVVHPATYDSGGMAPAEAMAWGLPGVGFDLEALKTYYPKGMIKTRCFNMTEFAENIIHLLSNPNYYQMLSKEAVQLINEQWDWEKQAQNIFDKSTSC